MNKQLILISGLLAAPLAPTAHASLVLDPANDFLATYMGPKSGDLDVLSTDVRFDGKYFLFDAQLYGAVGTTPGALYIWGINRGGASGGAFPGLIENVTFDGVVAAFSTGLALLEDLTDAAGPVTLPSDDVVISGDKIQVRVDASLLPSTGSDPRHYTFSFWPRSRVSTLSEIDVISDFAPETGMSGVTVVPEPGTWVTSLACAL